MPSAVALTTIGPSVAVAASEKAPVPRVDTGTNWNAPMVEAEARPETAISRISTIWVVLPPVIPMIFEVAAVTAEPAAEAVNV